MKIKLLIVMMSVLLFSSAAQAAIITYQISGGTGNTWSGAFDVNLLTVAASNAGNINSISSPGVGSILGINSVGVPGTLAIWSNPVGGSFIINSLALNTDLATSSTWSNILSVGTYSFTSAKYDDGVGGVLNNTGAGQITFSGGGASSVPEPGTMLLLGSGVLTFGLSRFRRRKEAAL